MKGKRPRYLFSFKSILLMSIVLALFAGVNVRPRECPGFSWMMATPLEVSGRPVKPGVSARADVMGQGWPGIFRRYTRSEHPPSSEHSELRLVWRLDPPAVPSASPRPAPGTFEGPWPGYADHTRLAINVLFALAVALGAGLALELLLFLRRRRATLLGEE